MKYGVSYALLFFNVFFCFIVNVYCYSQERYLPQISFWKDCTQLSIHIIYYTIWYVTWNDYTNKLHLTIVVTSVITQSNTFVHIDMVLHNTFYSWVYTYGFRKHNITGLHKERCSCTITYIKYASGTAVITFCGTTHSIILFFINNFYCKRSKLYPGKIHTPYSIFCRYTAFRTLTVLVMYKCRIHIYISHYVVSFL